MSNELTPDQQLLLWHLGLHGGRALQKEIEYKNIAKDRKDLERRGLLTVGREGRSFVLELKDRGWDELSKPTSVLPKSKKKPSRERVILQLLSNAVRSHASRQPVAVGEILRSGLNASPSSDVKQQIRSTDLQQEIRRAFFEIAGNPPQDSVRLSALRANLRDVPRQQLDEALLAMKSARKINLMNLDNPRDVQAEETSALRDGNRYYHVLWIER
jgi:hypothetical protein